MSISLLNKTKLSSAFDSKIKWFIISPLRGKDLTSADYWQQSNMNFPFSNKKK